MLTWLRESAGHEYRFLSSLHAADYLPAEPRFAVHYELLNRDRVERIRVKALLADPASAAGWRCRGHRPCGRFSDLGGGAPCTATRGRALPEIDSCVELFPTAEFQEREVFDFFGIVFKGHPDLTPDPAARGLRRLAAAARLPGRRRARDLHLQRKELWLSSS